MNTTGSFRAVGYIMMLTYLIHIEKPMKQLHTFRITSSIVIIIIVLLMVISKHLPV